MKEAAEVGVLVGRFQVNELHEGHKALISYVMAKHPKVILFLGLSPVRVTRNNPLDFEARKQMVLNEYPNVNVLYIKDVSSDEVWSKKLDDQIRDLVGPMATVALYGGRESFIDHYTGVYPTEEVQEKEFKSGTSLRQKLGAHVKADPAFRAGVIWAAYNRYPTTYPTIDVAIWNEDHTQLLMARKPRESKYRFIGGFVMPGQTLEETCRREVDEEAHISITDPEYIGSFPVDDWRYRREMDGILTSLFQAKHQFGRPTPDDDIEELKWFSIGEKGDAVRWMQVRKEIINSHLPLWDMLMIKELNFDPRAGGSASAY